MSVVKPILDLLGAIWVLGAAVPEWNLSEEVSPMRIPWLHGEAPGDSLSRSLICPLLLDEDPALIQGPSPKI